jgi:hypothetical protein
MTHKLIYTLIYTYIHIKRNPELKIKSKLKTYNIEINSISVVNFSMVRHSILCYQDRRIVVLFSYPVQQLSETPRYNLQIAYSISTGIPLFSRQQNRRCNDIRLV